MTDPIGGVSLSYDKEQDAVLLHVTVPCKDYDEIIGVDREHLLRSIISLMCAGMDSTYMERGEKWEVTALTPPTYDCILDDEAQTRLDDDWGEEHD